MRRQFIVIALSVLMLTGCGMRESGPGTVRIYRDGKVVFEVQNVKGFYQESGRVKFTTKDGVTLECRLDEQGQGDWWASFEPYWAEGQADGNR